MAEIFRPSYTTTDPKTGRKVKRQRTHWWIRYYARDASGHPVRRQVQGYTDRTATENLAVRLEREAAREIITEEEWLACEDPAAMLEFIVNKASDRKMTLLEIAYARHMWDRLPERRRQAERIRKAVEVAERKVERGVFRWKLSREFGNARRLLYEHAEGHYDGTVPPRLIFDIIGNPFRPVTLDPTWRTSTVTNLAQAIYNDLAFDRMPILADALEDAGCTNVDVLNHCRQPGVHVRGCWVVDLLLGKS